MTALIPARAWLLVAGAALIVGALWWLRHDAATDARNELAVEAAKSQERIRTNADAAARAAERDGAAERLRGGTFFAPMPPRD